MLICHNNFNKKGINNMRSFHRQLLFNHNIHMSNLQIACQILAHSLMIKKPSHDFLYNHFLWSLHVRGLRFFNQWESWIRILIVTVLHFKIIRQFCVHSEGGIIKVYFEIIIAKSCHPDTLQQSESGEKNVGSEGCSISIAINNLGADQV